MRRFHYEYKVPGGKLIVVDGAVEGARIGEVSFSGDFFIEPEEAFDALNNALVGVSTNASIAEVAARLDASLAALAQSRGESPQSHEEAPRGHEESPRGSADAPQSSRDAGDENLSDHGVYLHGFSTYDVAYAVVRGINGATDFYDHTWEVIHDEVRPTRLNVALDQYLLEQVAAGKRGPTLRFWEWTDTAAVIGAFQSYNNELHAEGVRDHSVEVVRRISGGGAMFMEGGNCITFSLYAPASLVAGLDYTAGYEFLDRWLLEALSSIGIKARYQPINDITSEAGKIGGAAQKRLRAQAFAGQTSGGQVGETTENGLITGNGEVILHHDTLSYDIDAEKMVQVLRIGKAKISDKGVRSAIRRVDPLRSQTGLSREDIIEHMIDVFIARTGATRGEVSADEVTGAEQLIADKFGTEEWTYRVP